MYFSEAINLYKKIIIVRKDLEMSPGKLAAQVSHGSMAFLTSAIRNPSYTNPVTKGMVSLFGSEPQEDWKDIIGYDFRFVFDKELYEQWINGAFTKCVLQAKNKTQLLKAKPMAESLGMQEGVDFFLIRDNCYTELAPEDEDGPLSILKSISILLNQGWLQA